MKSKYLLWIFSPLLLLQCLVGLLDDFRRRETSKLFISFQQAYVITGSVATLTNTSLLGILQNVVISCYRFNRGKRPDRCTGYEKSINSIHAQ